MILFPKLGITLEHVGTGISFFGFEIFNFGIIVGISLLLGLGFVLFEANHTRQNIDEYLSLSILVMVAGIFGARLYYVIFSWEYYKDSLMDVLQLRKGGAEFYGALIAGAVMIFVYAFTQKVMAGRILDTCCLGVAAGQVIASWGSFFSREGFGDYTDHLFAMQIPLDSISFTVVTENMRKHIEVIDGVRYVQVEPLFLLGFLWSIVVFAVVFLYKYRKKFEGELFLVYLLVYSFGRFLLEGVRVDALVISGTDWKACQVTAVLVALISAGCILYFWTQNDKARMRRVREREARHFQQRTGRKTYFK